MHFFSLSYFSQQSVGRGATAPGRRDSNVQTVVGINSARIALFPKAMNSPAALGTHRLPGHPLRR